MHIHNNTDVPARRDPRGFGFIEFRDARDADDALRSLDRSIMGGREISVSPVDREAITAMVHADVVH